MQRTFSDSEGPGRVEIRRASAEDARGAADVLIAARRAAVPAIPAPVHTAAEMRSWFIEHVMVSQQVWVAGTRSDIHAVMVLTEGWIEHLYVSPDRTSRGIGSKLLDHAKAMSAGELSLWTFASNHRAQQFYERHGFVAVARTQGDNEEGAPDIRYQWRRTDQLVGALTAAVDDRDFSGVILIQEGDRVVLELARGWADRAERRPISITTPMATASGTKGFTALTVVSMIEDDAFGLDTRLRDLVDDPRLSVDDGVTIRHLLGHTSGVGDYLDETQLDSSDDYVLDVPVHTLQGPRDYMALLGQHAQVEPPGSRFRYNNSGFVLLAMAIECAAGAPYHDEVRRRVFEPAGMTSTDFLRSDRLPAGVALGYLSDGRTNVHHLPVIGTGDGGAYTTAPDMVRFWDALFDGSIVSPSSVDLMATPNERAATDGADSADSADVYGLGFWVASNHTTVLLEGEDAGVSFRSGAERSGGLRFCLMANNADDVWPLARIVDAHLQP